MARQRTDLPVSSFAPELLAALREGTKREVRVPFASPQLAIRFRQRLNTLRLAMKREKHPDWEQFYRCGCYIDRLDRKIVIIAPRDEEFHASLRAAGINLEGGTISESSEASTPPPGIAPDDADAFLADLSKKE